MVVSQKELKLAPWSLSHPGILLSQAAHKILQLAFGQPDSETTIETFD
jgi:hypothetical protein